MPRTRSTTKGPTAAPESRPKTGSSEDPKPKNYFRGVRERPSGRYGAEIGGKGKNNRYLGTFDSEEEAARAYDRAALEKYKGKAKLNLPVEPAPQTIPQCNTSPSCLLSNRPGSDKFPDELSCLLATFNNLVEAFGTHPSNVHQAALESAKKTIRGIIYGGFDAFTNSETQEAFLASSQVLSSAGVFPSGDLKTRLAAFSNELANNATAFLEAQKDIDAAAEFFFVQKFLSEQAGQLPSLQECYRVADLKIADLRANLEALVEKRAKVDQVLADFVEETILTKVTDEADAKIAHLRAMVDDALEKRAKMGEVLTAIDEKIKTAKLKLASMSPQSADIVSRKLAAKMLIKQCQSSWLDLGTSLLEYL